MKLPAHIVESEDKFVEGIIVEEKGKSIKQKSSRNCGIIIINNPF